MIQQLACCLERMLIKTSSCSNVSYCIRIIKQVLSWNVNPISTKHWNARPGVSGTQSNKKRGTEALTSMIQFQISPNSTFCAEIKTDPPIHSLLSITCRNPSHYKYTEFQKIWQTKHGRVATAFQTSRWVGEGHNAILPLFHMHWLLPGKIRISYIKSSTRRFPSMWVNLTVSQSSQALNQGYFTNPSCKSKINKWD